MWSMFDGRKICGVARHVRLEHASGPVLTAACISYGGIQPAPRVIESAAEPPVPTCVLWAIVVRHARTCVDASGTDRLAVVWPK